MVALSPETSNATRNLNQKYSEQNIPFDYKKKNTYETVYPTGRRSEGHGTQRIPVLCQRAVR